MYLSLICSQVEIQLEMYKWMNSGGRSTAVVNLYDRKKQETHRRSKLSQCENLITFFH
uniref:Uncharacterized protein n=1 Tax=Anguilla anguilla TaxID=7936 RepID=A0A0E9W8F0_ANGAN